MCVFVAVSVRCARAPCSPLLYVEQAWWWQSRLTERSLKHRAPSGLCVCVCVCECVCARTITPLLHNPSCQTEACLSKPFLFNVCNTVPSTRGHTFNQVTAAWLSLTQKGHVNLSARAVQTWMSCRFQKNDGLLFLGPCILSLCSGRPMNKVTHPLIDACASL